MLWRLTIRTTARRIRAQSDREKSLAILKAHAAPTKEFFVRMITKDIDLEDCILDLIDNCLDGARRSSANAPDAKRYAGFAARIEVTLDRFKIEDNCGGISVDQAIDYAFHFGRRKDAPPGDHAIGLYGIGMKRAIFKIGNSISIRSSTVDDSFGTHIDVDAWLAATQNPKRRVIAAVRAVVMSDERIDEAVKYRAPAFLHGAELNSAQILMFAVR